MGLAVNREGKRYKQQLSTASSARLWRLRGRACAELGGRTRPDGAQAHFSGEGAPWLLDKRQGSGQARAPGRGAQGRWLEATGRAELRRRLGAVLEPAAVHTGGNYLLETTAGKTPALHCHQSAEGGETPWKAGTDVAVVLVLSVQSGAVATGSHGWGSGTHTSSARRPPGKTDGP